MTGMEINKIGAEHRDPVYHGARHQTQKWEGIMQENFRGCRPETVVVGKSRAVYSFLLRVYTHPDS